MCLLAAFVIIMILIYGTAFLKGYRAGLITTGTLVAGLALAVSGCGVLLVVFATHILLVLLALRRRSGLPSARIMFNCSACGQRVAFGRDPGGRMVVCPHCRAGILVPNDGEAPPDEPPVPLRPLGIDRLWPLVRLKVGLVAGAGLFRAWSPCRLAGLPHLDAGGGGCFIPQDIILHAYPYYGH